MERKTCGDCIFYHGIHDDCGVCTLFETDETFDKTCDFVYSCKDFQPKQPITNGDRIRQMSNDELAKFFGCLRHLETCPHAHSDYPCEKCNLDWLDAPAKEGGR